MATLPLFPLGSALMPGDLLSLNVFEERYLTLVQSLIESQHERDPVFGVVAIKEGFEVGADSARALHPVGTVARLARVALVGQDRMAVVVEGTSRFMLNGLDTAAGTPYLTGEVTHLGEPDGDTGQLSRLADLLRAAVTAYAVTLDEDIPETPEDDRRLAYWLPQAVTLDLHDRQSLLASPDTEARLRLGLGLLRRELTLASSYSMVGYEPGQSMWLN
jgi:uncharacterized protein